jgi:hypothetical protein
VTDIFMNVDYDTITVDGNTIPIPNDTHDLKLLQLAGKYIAKAFLDRLVGDVDDDEIGVRVLDALRRRYAARIQEDSLIDGRLLAGHSKIAARVIDIATTRTVNEVLRDVEVAALFARAVNVMIAPIETPVIGDDAIELAIRMVLEDEQTNEIVGATVDACVGRAQADGLFDRKLDVAMTDCVGSPTVDEFLDRGVYA